MSVVQTYYRDLFRSGSAKPLRIRADTAIAAGASSANATIQTVPPGKAWIITALYLSGATGVSVAASLIDDVDIGQGVAAGGAVEKDLTTRFGRDGVPLRNTFKVVASNSGASAANLTSILFGWEITL